METSIPTLRKSIRSPLQSLLLQSLIGQAFPQIQKKPLESSPVLNCIQFGTCSASCPSGKLTAFRVRQLIRRTLLGLDSVLKNMMILWLCTTCYTCLERCPWKIEIAPVIIALRNLAVEKGYMIPRHREVAQLFIKYGHAVPINNENIAKRESLGLTRIPQQFIFLSTRLKSFKHLSG